MLHARESDTKPQPSQRHVPALDGLRGLALLFVFWFHITIDWRQFPGLVAVGSWGWMGVDLFFVLSGYLITGILLDECGQQEYFRRFYARRILRIVPAYTAFVLILLWIAPMTGLMLPEEHGALVEREAWYWTYSTNVLLAARGWSALPFATGHLWSLAVEEQFYVVWPVLIAYCGTPRRASRLASGVILVVVVTRTIAVRSALFSGAAVYALTPLRADALAWGALVAGLQRERWRQLDVGSLWRYWMGGGLLVVLLVIVRLGSGGSPSPSMQILGYPAVDMAAAGLLGYAISRPARWLSVRPLRLIGRHSYGLYIWHPPVLLLLERTLHLNWVEFALASLVLSASLAWISWVAVESPALRLKRCVPRVSVRSLMHV